MYKIYINKTKLILIPTEDLPHYPAASKDILVSPYNGKRKTLFNFIDMFEKSDRIKQCVIYYPDFDELQSEFLSIYKIVEAGGGVVENENGEILFIHRRGYWDLPKGKIDKGETKEEAAVREVEEETGVKGLELKDHILTTHHSYRNRKDRRCIKVSHWYRMSCESQDLIPQTEEDIEQATWLSREAYQSIRSEAYDSIIDVMQNYYNEA